MAFGKKRESGFSKISGCAMHFIFNTAICVAPILALLCTQVLKNYTFAMNENATAISIRYQFY